MSQKQIQRIKVIENAAEGRISVAKAAELLELSTRQVKRLKRSQREGRMLQQIAHNAAEGGARACQPR